MNTRILSTSTEESTTISESSLLRSLNSVNRYSARDIADLCQLYLVSLHILRSDFSQAPWARDYARRTISYNNYDQLRIQNTDLYQFLNMLTHKPAAWMRNMKQPVASELFMQDVHVDVTLVNRFLHGIASAKFDARSSGRLLMQLERDLKIQVQNYRSMRRIAADWSESHVTTEAKSLVITRMLQAMRHRAHQGDMLPALTQLAREQKLEIDQACDAETGKNCDITQPGEKPASLLKQIAVGAGLGLGAYMLGKALFGGKQS
jgi:hypothetical protein